MKILLTGGTGSVGKAVIIRLTESGHAVRVIGRRNGITVENAEYISCDINDFSALLEVTRGVDAIVHLAAVPNPLKEPPEEIFRINVAGTFNVYHAAARCGIRRVVSASSINALGFNFGRRAFPIAYFPVDEDLPGYSTDVYSFSKHVLEEIGSYYWRRDGISGTCLRIPWVYHADDEIFERFRGNLGKYREAMEELTAMDAAARRSRVMELIADFDTFRLDRYRKDTVRRHDYAFDRFPLMWGRSDFWTVIDERDSAQAVERSLTAEYEGCHPLFVNDSHNHTGIESRFLAEHLYPVPDAWSGKWKRPVSGTDTLVSIERARELIGFEPRYSISRFFD